VAESPRSHDEPAAEDDVKRQGRANLPRLHAVKSDRPEPDLPSDDESAPFNAALELVRAASDALERMRVRCREVEAFAQQEVEYHRAQLATADTVIRELDNKTAAQEDTIRQLQAQADADLEDRQRLQRSLDEMRSAFERSQHLLRAAEDRATASEAWLGRLHTEIASAFSELPPGPAKPPVLGPR
jgi:chromosome segregation ATPase